MTKTARKLNRSNVSLENIPLELLEVGLQTEMNGLGLL